MQRALPTAETLAFLKRHLPKAPLRILDVGCGRGEVAAGLAAVHGVRAIDASDDAVKHARRNGVSAEQADFLRFVGGPFDAIYFGCSLHHIHPIADAVDRARSLLAPGGLLLAEEFALERMDKPTARWLYGAGAMLERAGLLLADEHRPKGEDPLEVWRQHHAHQPPLHTSEAMESALGGAFEWVERSDAPYLYRYFCDRIPGETAGEKLALKLFENEKTLIEERQIRAIGRRLVARKKS